jgi:hypothetical protein
LLIYEYKSPFASRIQNRLLELFVCACTRHCQPGQHRLQHRQLEQHLHLRLLLLHLKNENNNKKHTKQKKQVEAPPPAPPAKAQPRAAKSKAMPRAAKSKAMPSPPRLLPMSSKAPAIALAKSSASMARQGPVLLRTSFISFSLVVVHRTVIVVSYFPGLHTLETANKN